MAELGVTLPSASNAQGDLDDQEAPRGILNTIVLGQNNGHAEGVNSRIQRIKQCARRFRNKERSTHAIYFQLDGLDLYPTGFKHA